MTATEARIQHRAPLEKVYGNLNDIVSYEEKQMENQLRRRDHSPTSSQITIKRGLKQHDKYGGSRRMTGLEAIYLQKFDKQ